MGWVVSSYSLGQIFGSPLGGWLSNELSSKRILLISSFTGLLSSFLYAVAPGYVYILFSRLLTGLSAGFEFTTELAFIAHNTSAAQRTTFLASVTAANVVGFIIGPALGNLLAMLDLQVFGLRIDQYTGPGWLLAAMFLTRSMSVMNRLKRHMGLIVKIMGALLVLVGLALVTGAFSMFSWWLLETFPALANLG